MKIKLNDDVIKRIISQDDTCTKCWWFKNSEASCNPFLQDLCVTENICYIFHPYKSDDSIFLI